MERSSPKLYTLDEDDISSEKPTTALSDRRLKKIFNFDYIKGVVVDFQQLYHYKSPVDPVMDVKFVDFFDPMFLKAEQVMIKVHDRFEYAEFSVRYFGKPNDFLIRTISDLSHPSEITSEFIQYKIYAEYKRFPNFNFPHRDDEMEDDQTYAHPNVEDKYQNVKICIDAVMALEDECMFNFINLVVAMKYIKILQKFDSSTRQLILNKREPMLKSYIGKSCLRNNPSSVEFYEWFLTLMQSYADHNTSLFELNRRSSCPVSGGPFFLPFVGSGPSSEFSIAQKSYCISLDDEEDNNSSEMESCIDAEEICNDSCLSNQSTLTSSSLNSQSTIDESEDSDSQSAIDDSEDISDQSYVTDDPLFQDPVDYDQISKESNIFNEALSNMMEKRYKTITPERMKVANSMKEISVAAITEMSTNVHVNQTSLLGVDHYDSHEWELLRQYVRICREIFVGGSEEDKRINEAETKKDLNDLRLQYMNEYIEEQKEEKRRREGRLELISRICQKLYEEDMRITRLQLLKEQKGSETSQSQDGGSVNPTSTTTNSSNTDDDDCILDSSTPLSDVENDISSDVTLLSEDEESDNSSLSGLLTPKNDDLVCNSFSDLSRDEENISVFLPSKLKSQDIAYQTPALKIEPSESSSFLSQDSTVDNKPSAPSFTLESPKTNESDAIAIASYMKPSITNQPVQVQQRPVVPKKEKRRGTIFV